MNNKLQVNLPGMILDNPIMPASGTFGYGYEFSKFYDINILGTIMTKGTTYEPRFGNPTPRVAETNAGMLNAIGLQNPGIKDVLKIELTQLSNIFHKKVILNIAGNDIEEYVKITKEVPVNGIIGAIELNISCPNVKKGGIAYGVDKNSAYELVKAVKEVSQVPIYVKLSPNVTNIKEIAIAVEQAGADAITMINTLIGMRCDYKSGKPLIANITGGLSGPAILPIALKMIYDVYKVVKIPIIGMGGVSCAKDVIEMMSCGATAVAIGTMNLVDPFIMPKIINELPLLLKELKIDHITQLIGRSHLV